MESTFRFSLAQLFTYNFHIFSSAGFRFSLCVQRSLSCIVPFSFAIDYVYVAFDLSLAGESEGV